MQKLVEREAVPRPGTLAAAPALAVQFFLIPLAVVAVLVAVYAGFQLLLTSTRTPEEYLSDVRAGTRDRQWPAAFELSRRLADPQIEAKHPQLARALLAAFREAKGDDPRVRRYLALALGRLKTPAAGTVPALLEAARDPDGAVAIASIWALGAIGDESAVAGLRAAYASSKDAGVRKVVVYALGRLPGDTQRSVLYEALADPAPDVRWNAAAALAARRDPRGTAVVRQMLDRAYLERIVAAPAPATLVDRFLASVRDTADPVDDVMISGVRAAVVLRDPSLVEPITALSRADRSPHVREVAREALKQM